MKTRLKAKLFWAAVLLCALAVAIALPNFPRSYRARGQAACINNLRQLDGAMQQWALEHHQPLAARITFADLSPYLRNELVCPEKGAYQIGPAVSNGPSCSVPLHRLPAAAISGN